MAGLQNMKRAAPSQNYQTYFDLFLNLALFVAAFALGLWSFFALQEILLTLGAYVIAATVDGPLRGKYSLLTLRNFWLLGGGAFLAGLGVFCLDYFFKHWRARRLRRFCARALVLELCFIGLSMWLAG